MVSNQEPAYNSGFSVQKVEVDPDTGEGQIVFKMSLPDAKMLQQHIDAQSRISIHFTIRPKGPVDLMAASPPPSAIATTQRSNSLSGVPKRPTSIADYTQ